MQQISFNQYLEAQARNPASPYHALAKQWVTTRGRLTRDSAERRLSGAGAAFDAYTNEVVPTPNLTQKENNDPTE